MIASSLRPSAFLLILFAGGTASTILWGDMSNRSMSAALIMGGQIYRVILSLATFAILARFITPEDYGRFAILAAVFVIGELVRDSGLSVATIQTRTLSPGLLSNIFWINAGLGVSLLGACLGAGILLHWLDSGSWAAVPLIIVGLSNLMNALSSPVRARVNRLERYRTLAAADFFAANMGAASAIAVGWAGGGVLAPLTVLAVQSIGSGAYLAWRAPFPVLRWTRGEPIWHILAFGRATFLAQLVTYIANYLDTLLLSFAAPMKSVGLYDRSFQLASIPGIQLLGPATALVLPQLSRAQDSDTAVAAGALRAQALLLVPVSAGMSLAVILADPMLPALLGDEWGKMVDLFRILSVGGLATVTTYFSYWYLVATARGRSLLHLTLATRPLTMVGILGGLPWGVEGVALGYSVAQVAYIPIATLWVSSASGLPAVTVMRTIIASGGPTASAAASFVVLSEPSNGVPWVPCAAACLVFVSWYLTSWRARASVIEFAAVLRRVASSSVAFPGGVRT